MIAAEVGNGRLGIIFNSSTVPSIIFRYTNFFLPSELEPMASLAKAFTNSSGPGKMEPMSQLTTQNAMLISPRTVVGRSEPCGLTEAPRGLFVSGINIFEPSNVR